MRFRAALTALGPALALIMSAQTALSDAHAGTAEEISATESALADLLITLAELELALTQTGGATLPPPPDGGDLLDRVTARLALLDSLRAAVPEAAEGDKLAGLPAPEGPDKPLPAAPVDPAGSDTVAPDGDIDPIAAALGFADGADSAPPPGPVEPPPAAAVTPAPAAPAPAPADEPFVAVSLDGTSVRSLLLEELAEADRAALPDATACADLGEWFLSLPLRRDVKSVFVIEGEYVRICRELGQTWRVKRATNRDRAHLVKRAD